MGNVRHEALSLSLHSPRFALRFACRKKILQRRELTAVEPKANKERKVGFERSEK